MASAKSPRYSHLNSSSCRPRARARRCAGTRDGEEQLNDSLVDELHMSAGIQRAIEAISAAAPPVMCACAEDTMLVRLRDFARSHNHTPANRRTHMRLDELDGESGLADTCTSAKGLRTSGPVRPASGAGFGEWELRRASEQALSDRKQQLCAHSAATATGTPPSPPSDTALARCFMDARAIADSRRPGRAGTALPRC